MRELDCSTLSQSMSNEESLKGALQDANAQLIAIFNATPDAFIIFDQNGKIELINDVTETMFLYNKQALRGQNVDLLIPDAFQQFHESERSSSAVLGKLSVSGKGRKLRAKKANGQGFLVILNIEEVKHRKHIQFVAVIRDISEQVQFQLALANSKKKLTQATRFSSMDELTAGIAHEINQPLSAISSYAQAAKRMINSPNSDHTKTISQTLEKICEQALRANQVINRFRAVVNKQISRREKVPIFKLIHETVELAKLDLRLLDLEIVLDIDESQEIEVLADPIQLQQVLLNLFQNALDAMDPAKPSPITVKCQLLSKSDIEISIADCGNGIDEQVALHIFTPFFTTKNADIGMGLNVCQSIIHAHGGRIYYASNQPNGCVFSFSLPVLYEEPQKCEEPT